MKDPIWELSATMSNRGLDPDLIHSICSSLRANHEWKEETNPASEKEVAKFQVKNWTTIAGDWTIKVFDFLIGDQEGFPPGAHGQNFAMANIKMPEGKVWPVWPNLCVSDDKVWHDIAHELYREITMTEFMGSGSLPTRDQLKKMLAHYKLETGNLDLRDPDQLRLAVNWQIKHVNSIKEGGRWQMTLGGHALFRLWHSRKVAQIVEGAMIMPVRIAFYAMGWTIEDDFACAHDKMLCRFWASLYAP